MSNRKAPSNTELVISLVLQVGVIVSTLIILTGLVSFFTHGDSHHTSYHEYATSNYLFPHSLSSIKGTLRSSQGSALIELGILLLILTPVVRVVASVILFLRQHDKPMTIVTLSVLTVLVGSFIFGLAIH